MIVTAENKFSYVWQLPENIGRGQGVCTAQQHLCELISHIADGKPAADWDSRRWPVWLRRTWRRLGGKSMSLQWQLKMVFWKCQMHSRWRTGMSFNIFSNNLLRAPVQLIKQNYTASLKPFAFTSFLHKNPYRNVKVSSFNLLNSTYASHSGTSDMFERTCMLSLKAGMPWKFGFRKTYSGQKAKASLPSSCHIFLGGVWHMFGENSYFKWF